MKLLLSTRQSSPKTIAKIAKGAGLDGIELMMPSPLKPPLRRWSYQGVDNILVIHASNDFYDPPRFERALINAVAVARDVGAKVVNIHCPSAHPSLGGAENLNDCLRFLKEATTEYSDILICCEVLAPPDPTSERQLKQFSYLPPAMWANTMGLLQMGATLDTTHIAAYAMEPDWFVRNLGKLLRHLHLSDYSIAQKKQHLFPGRGNINWDAFFSALKALGRKDIYGTIEPSEKFDLTKSSQRKQLDKSIEFLLTHLKGSVRASS